MEFELSEEQVLLRDTVRDVLGRKYGDIENLRAVTDTELGWSRDVWSALAEIGILGLVFDEADGGTGAGPEELAPVMGEFGATIAPEPFLDAVVVPGLLVTRTADPETRAELIGGLSSGERLCAFAHHENGDRWPAFAIATSFADGRLTGTKSLVAAGDCADTLVVSARDEAGQVGLYLVDGTAEGLKRTGYRTHDRRRGAQIEFDGAPATRLGSGDATAVIAEVEVLAQTALCAEAVGAMRASLEMTTGYLKTRKQFGVPLATFQALTHRAADMYVSLELATSLSVYATAALAEGRVDPVIASRAKLQICRSGRHIGQESIQMHGGIGMTAEYPVAHYVSRLTAIGHTLGDADSHLQRLSASISEWDMVTVG
ncbi:MULTISPECIES: acyl-CoA dehydrogenase family protein [Gordonia]|uniref:Putative acyl-CoA dehydrogenase n=1 Tax=Gordonia sihwensis NBRC 108236 TaxID=1223544 RepID=L7LN83_9ACTN|nr:MULTISPECIES: acyl-CoA dehydrogenase family protein [Gordonia]AUH67176.1 acyl-CoA dehydrogenase [Gordonia sp. YC-JH1]GAC61557.1 putative acyl-CoA dehydrogenase [Gordonia sihwensis NBRC 108236]